MDSQIVFCVGHFKLGNKHRDYFDSAFPVFKFQLVNFLLFL